MLFFFLFLLLSSVLAMCKIRFAETTHELLAINSYFFRAHMTTRRMRNIYIHVYESMNIAYAQHACQRIRNIRDRKYQAYA